MAKGWIVLARQIQDHWLWNSKKPFDERSAWIDLLLLANYEDKKLIYKGEVITCERGVVNLSIKSLSERWGWSRDRATRYLRALESDGMCTIKATTNRTTITIENYGFFQDQPATNKATNKATSRQRADTTNNNNKDNNIIYKPNKFNQFEKQAYDMEAIERSLEL